MNKNVGQESKELKKVTGLKKMIMATVQGNKGIKMFISQDRKETANSYRKVKK